MTTPVQCWVDIETPAGVKQGSGPLRHVISWQSTALLSRAGNFALTIPTGEPQADQLLPKRVVRCWAIVGGAKQEIGAGIIDRVQLQGDTIVVTGPDLLAELRYRSVHDLKLFAEVQYTPTRVLFWNGITYDDLADCYDNDLSSSDPFALAATNSYLLIGYSTPFNVIYCYQATTEYNTVASAVNYGYSDGAGNWPEFEAVSDTLSTGGVPWALATVDNDPLSDGTGIVLFPRNAAWAQETIDGTTAYWVRFDPEETLDSVRVDEFVVGVRNPTTADVSGVMNLAPAAWSSWDADVGGAIFDSTTDGTYAVFAGETLLSALTKIADRAGESFRLGPNRTLHWLHSSDDTFASSGLRAMRYTGNPRMDANALVCYIVAMERNEDSAELITRVYPFGAGNGQARVTLSNATLTMPSGYVMDTAANYIKRTSAETTYGQIEAVLAFKDVRETEDFMGDSVEVCDQLAQLALKYLERHSQINEFYRLDITHLQQLVQVGTTIRVIYREPRSGALVVDIDEELIILGATHAFAAGQVYTAALDVGNVNAWPLTDAEIVANAIEQGTIYAAHTQAVSSAAIRNL